MLASDYYTFKNGSKAKPGL